MRLKLTSLIVLTISFTLGMLLLSSCTGGRSDDPGKLASKYNSVFASADAETKGLWNLAGDALKTNGYVVAMQALQTLTQQNNLSTEQASAAQQTVTALSDKMYDAANRGDMVAKDAIEELRKLRSR